MTTIVLQPILDQTDFTDVADPTVAAEQFLAYDFKTLIDVLTDTYTETSYKYGVEQLLDIFQSVDFRDGIFDNPWEDQSVIERSLPLIPSNLGGYLPSNLKIHEEPYIFTRWIFSKTLGLDYMPVLHIFNSMEATAIISTARSITNDRERELVITKHIRQMLIGAIYHFTPKEMLLDALDHITDWADYFMDTAGCYQDGNLDLNLAALNSLKRKWGMK